MPKCKECVSYAVIDKTLGTGCCRQNQRPMVVFGDEEICKEGKIPCPGCHESIEPEEMCGRCAPPIDRGISIPVIVCEVVTEGYLCQQCCGANTAYIVIEKELAHTDPGQGYDEHREVPTRVAVACWDCQTITKIEIFQKYDLRVLNEDQERTKARWGLKPDSKMRIITDDHYYPSRQEAEQAAVTILQRRLRELEDAIADYQATTTSVENGVVRGWREQRIREAEEALDKGRQALVKRAFPLEKIEKTMNSSARRDRSRGGRW